MNNPFADKDNFIDYGKKGKDVNIKPNIQQTAHTFDPSIDDVLDFIDEAPAKEGKKTQQEWINHFNDEKKMMISAPVVYKVAKRGTWRLIDNILRACVDDNYLITSTRVMYNEDNFGATVIHGFGGPHPLSVNYTDVPVYHLARLDELVNSSEGMSYLGLLFGINERKEDIVYSLERLAGKSNKQILFNTLDPLQRIEGFGASITFHFKNNAFYINNVVNVTGFQSASRGVSVLK